MAKGDICKHGIRWPWDCHDCNEEMEGQEGDGADQTRQTPRILTHLSRDRMNEMDDNTAYGLSQAVVAAIDAALDAGATADEVKAELAYQIENYDWDAE